MDSSPTQGYPTLDDSSVPEYLVRSLLVVHLDPPSLMSRPLFSLVVWRRSAARPAEDPQATSPTSRSGFPTWSIEPHRCSDRQEAQTWVKDRSRLWRRRQGPERRDTWWYRDRVPEADSKVQASDVMSYWRSPFRVVTGQETNVPWLLRKGSLRYRKSRRSKVNSLSIFVRLLIR